MFEYYTIAIIAILAAISPGPDFVIVSKNALTHNRRSGIWTSLGVGVGILVHSVYCVLGLALVISQSLLLFSMIKYLGAAYLIYLGIKSLISQSSQLPMLGEKKSVDYSYKRAFRDGLLTNVLNPKCTLLMLSIFTLVVRPTTPVAIQATYGIEISVIHIIWFTLLSCGLSVKAVRLRLAKLQQVLSKVMGGVLIMLGIAVLFESR